jgi:hypothetical protein
MTFIRKLSLSIDLVFYSETWLNSVNSESLKNPWNPKSIKTDYFQSQTKSESPRNPRKSRTPRNPKNPRIYCILSAVPKFHEFWILEESTLTLTAERIQGILEFFGFLRVFDFLRFFGLSDLVWLWK